MSAAIKTGYTRGLSTIIDANVVTLLTAFILFILATAGVQGFALMLGLGTIVTLFTAVLATNALLGLVGARWLTNPRMVGARTHGRKRLIDFNGATKLMFTLSGVILLVSAIAISTKGITFGIDFESGTRIESTFQRTTSEDAIRDVLGREGLADAEVQRVTGDDAQPNSFRISTEQLPPAEVSRVNNALRDEFGIRGSPNTQSIGPTFGESVARSAIIAVIASLFVIAVYIALRFEWKYAVTTAISLTHDLLIASGLYAMTGREVTSSTVAALLTVLGFSLYDTIIVSDRIRENAPRMPRATFSQICQPVDERGHRPLAVDRAVRVAAHRGVDGLRRRDAAGLRVRAAGRHGVRRLLVDLHLLARAHALEGARARVPPPPPGPAGALRRGAGVRARGRRRRGRARQAQARRPPHGARRSRAPRLEGRVRRHGARHRARDRRGARAAPGVPLSDARQPKPKPKPKPQPQSRPTPPPAPAPEAEPAAEAPADDAAETPPPAPEERAADATPEDLVLKDDAAKRRRQRNRRHGRPR